MSRGWTVAPAACRVLAGCVATACLALPGAAIGAPVTLAQFHRLSAGAASGSQRALNKLLQVTAVSGHPVAIGMLLGAGTPGELAGRIRALEVATTSSSSGAPPAATAGLAAEQILRGSRYGKATVPDPLANLLDDLAKLIVRVASGTPGGPVLFWALCTALALGLGAMVARRTLRRLDRRSSTARTQALSAGPDPVELEKRARAAEADGDFARAVRLRFQAGLLRLSSRSVIEYRPSLLTADVAQRLSSPVFDELADTFQRVAYGGQNAASEDATASRRGWETVLKQAGASR